MLHLGWYSSPKIEIKLKITTPLHFFTHTLQSRRTLIQSYLEIFLYQLLSMYYQISYTEKIMQTKKMRSLNVRSEI